MKHANEKTHPPIIIKTKYYNELCVNRFQKKKKVHVSYTF